jgi:hypothetical protein
MTTGVLFRTPRTFARITLGRVARSDEKSGTLHGWLP